VFVNEMPRYEILSEEAMDTLDRGWRRIVSELGVEFMLPEAVDYFEKAGQRVEDNKVFLDPEFVLEQVAKAPSEFDLQARNPDHTVHIGGDHMVFAGVYGPPFVRKGEERGDAKIADFENFVRLGQSFPEMDSAGGTVVEPEDRPLDSRHLDMVYALQTLSDKPYMGSVISAENANDTVEMGKIAAQPGFSWLVVRERLASWGGLGAAGLALVHVRKLFPALLPEAAFDAIPCAPWRTALTLPMRSRHPLDLFRGTRRRWVQLWIAGAALERPSELPGYLVHRATRDTRAEAG